MRAVGSGGMRKLLVAALVALLMTGWVDGDSGSDSSESNQSSAETPDANATLDKIIAEAIDADKIQIRGKEGDELW